MSCSSTVKDLRDTNPEYRQHGSTFTTLNVPRNNQPIPPHALENPITVRIPFPIALQTVGLRNFVIRCRDLPTFSLRGCVNYDMNATRVNSQTLIFTPFDALWPETDYVLTLQRGIRCWRRGPHIMEDEFSIAFKTRRRLTTSICITAPQPPRNIT
mmetsp:Transcript_33471/g.56220  ORF Transcript_33471/g.56220 Transcript_33471/m.56220 type:complete len:156 (-) Transcript_33471:36-503(-)